jgi:hypothetical protein
MVDQRAALKICFARTARIRANYLEVLPAVLRCCDTGETLRPAYKHALRERRPLIPSYGLDCARWATLQDKVTGPALPRLQFLQHQKLKSWLSKG